MTHTREEHAGMLEAHFGDRGLLYHQYRSCGFSGAGNCCCGRPKESSLHPHVFRLARVAREQGRWFCTCGNPEDHPSHQRKEGCP